MIHFSRFLQFRPSDPRWTLDKFAKGEHRKKDRLAPRIYPPVTFLVERRLMKIYPALAKHVSNTNISEIIRGLISDEGDHLTMIMRRLNRDFDDLKIDRSELVEIETILATKWMRQIEVTLCD